MKPIIFLTGATGLIGGNLVLKILQSDPSAKLILLVRADDDYQASWRIQETLRTLAPQIDLNERMQRIEVVRGDITQSNLGLSEDSFEYLTRKVTHIIHCAATVEFQLPYECAHSVNYVGTVNVISLARKCLHYGKLKRLAHFSTAYVSGNRDGIIYEDQLDCGQSFSNTYELTKFETELYLRKLKRELPITVFRPGIVVGHSKTGITCAFNVLYAPLKLISKGLVRVLPGSPEIPMDVIPVDYLCDVVYHIVFQSDTGIGKTLHLTAGPEKATTTGEITSLAVEFFNRSRCTPISPVRFAPLRIYQLLRNSAGSQSRKIYEALQLYEPYLTVPKFFDCTNTGEALNGSDLFPPAFINYYWDLLHYCLKTNWGKNLDFSALQKEEVSLI